MMVLCKKKDCFFRQGCAKEKSSYSYCGYSLITGELRGCPADNCNQYLPKSKAKKIGFKFKEE